MYSSGFVFHFYRQSFHGYDLYGLSFILTILHLCDHELFALAMSNAVWLSVSLVALQYSPSTKTFPPLASIGVSAFTVFPAIVPDVYAGPQ
jgi:hypothetical protein